MNNKYIVLLLFWRSAGPTVGFEFEFEFDLGTQKGMSSSHIGTGPPPGHSRSYVNNIIIPGSSINSDLCTTVGFFKCKVRSILLQLQSKGDSKTWDNRNFNPKFINGPCWTWGM